MLIDGYSLDSQKTKMKAFCDYNEYEIAGEYEDAGKIRQINRGRVSFNQMMEGRMQKSNDDYKGYKEVATQENFDKF